MKYYETHYEEYIHSVEQYNIHPELSVIYDNLPKNRIDFGNLIIFGPTGSGKYSQVLYFLKKYSPTKLKYDKKITCQTDKISYIYHISDIHYEIDMSILGCNSKTLWHEIFLQIVDIVSMKTEKTGIIVCKNFHMIHNELLDIFYSYIQQFNSTHMNIQVKFIIVTENINSKIVTYFSYLPVNVDTDVPDIGYIFNNLSIGVNELHIPTVFNRELRKIYDSLQILADYLSIKNYSVSNIECNKDFCWSWDATSCYELKLPVIKTCSINPISYIETTVDVNKNSRYVPVVNPEEIITWEKAKSKCCIKR
jgi:hypothetical protein